MMKDDAIVIERIFNAPLKRVWGAWTTPEIVKKWWGPKGFSAPSIEIDFQVGGKYIYCMRGPKGTPWDKDMYSAGIYKEIDPFEKIVTTDYFSDKDGNKANPKDHGLEGDMPTEMNLTVLFEDLGDDKTKVTLVYPKPKNKAQFEAMKKSGMEDGWSTSLEKLANAIK